jgi:hypothetical protein
MINAEAYSQQLEKMYSVLVENYPALVKRKRVSLQQDTARPHTAKKNLQNIEELLPHPAFSPIFSHQTTYYLFRSMAQSLRGKKFLSVAPVEFSVEEFVASKDKEWFYHAFKELAEKWVKTTQRVGLYSEY